MDNNGYISTFINDVKILKPRNVVVDSNNTVYFVDERHKLRYVYESSVVDYTGGGHGFAGDGCRFARICPVQRDWWLPCHRPDAGHV